ncbi:MAG: preprotein translocase subunit SecE [Planctomycetota bacterium]|jgi:preprotein translocase SecE subunit
MEAYKTGQGSFARLAAVMGLVIAAFLGCVELYSWIQQPDDQPILPGRVFEDLPLLGVPLSITFLGCVALFLVLLWLIRKWLSRPAVADALIETEMELKKVSWPTRDESVSATWIVIMVTLLLTISLAFFDIVLRSVLDLIF